MRRACTTHPSQKGLNCSHKTIRAPCVHPRTHSAAITPPPPGPRAVAGGGDGELQGRARRAPFIKVSPQHEPRRDSALRCACLSLFGEAMVFTQSSPSCSSSHGRLFTLFAPHPPPLSAVQPRIPRSLPDSDSKRQRGGTGGDVPSRIRTFTLQNKPRILHFCRRCVKRALKGGKRRGFVPGVAPRRGVSRPATLLAAHRQQ